MGISSITQRFIKLRPSLGWRGAVQYIIQQRRLFHRPSTKPYKLYSKYAKYPLWVRPDTSDLSVFRQIYIELEYSCLDDISSASLIVDCGANVGYSSAYFLSRFPNSQIICIEPDPSNFAMLKENMKPYGDRTKLLQAGVWSHQTELKIAEVPYRDGGKWAVQVCEVAAGDKGEIPAVDIGSILNDSGFERISILKMDIEGAEVVVFSENYEHWLPRLDNLVIELHDDSSFGPASELVMNTVTNHKDFTISTFGELTVFKSTVLAAK